MSSLLVVAGLVSVAAAQYSGWDISDAQINTTICTWQGLQAAVIRDTVYMDGGELWWRPGLGSGEYDQVQEDISHYGEWALSLNFSTAFNMSQNITALFDMVDKGPAAVLYSYGAMLANDAEFFLYGGSSQFGDTEATPVDHQGVKFKAYNYAVDAPDFQPFSIGSYELDDYGLTRNIAYGAAANAPSENLAFYFSGLRSPTFEQTIYPPLRVNTTALNVSNTLITLNMGTQNAEEWSNSTLPDSISGRASAEMVWVPVGEKGILVALGGVVDPAFVQITAKSANATESELQSPKFMTNIDVYDIANEAWYTQTTSGEGPGALAQGCAVMQPAQDSSSFNIYWYGGYDGLNSEDSSLWNDAVWVLSLPSFTWTKAIEGRTGVTRAGHKCVMPYPDQMMVIGGATAFDVPGTLLCAAQTEGNAGIIQLFNVSSAQWLDRYDPEVWSSYSVPSVVYKAIGGDGSGGATATQPDSWDDNALGEVFKTAYDTSKITKYYPYSPAATTTSGTNPTITPGVTKSSGGGLPKYLPPLLGVILGLIFISTLVVLFVLWRRRKLLQKNGGVSVVPTEEHGNRIMSWINGQPRPGMTKAETVTTTEELTHPGSPSPNVGLTHMQQPLASYFDAHNRYQPQELDRNEIVELPAITPAAELSDDQLSASAVADRSFNGSYYRYGSSVGYGSLQHTDQGSMVSSASFARNAPGPPPPPSSTSHGGNGGSSVADSQPPNLSGQREVREVRPDSSALPTPLARELAANKDLPEVPTPSPRGDSGVSAFSEREHAHLRNTSDPATVSTMDAVISSPPRTSHMSAGHRRVGRTPKMEEGALEAANAQQPPGIVSPPTNGTAESGEDYINARANTVVSPVEARTEQPPRPGSRTSAFRENAEDLGGSGRS